MLLQYLYFTVDNLKKKWKNLRDNYAKYLRSEKTHTGQESKIICRYKAWPWAKQMEFFRQFIRFANTSSNIPESDTLNSPLPDITEQDDKLAGEENTENSSSTHLTEPVVEKNATTPCQKKKLNTTSHQAAPQQSGVDKVLDYISKRSTNMTEQYDHIDKIFLGYAASVKKLSPRRQILIKYNIAKMLMTE